MAKNYDTEYLPDLFKRPKTTIKNVTKMIKKYFPDCTGVVASSGISGASILIPVATGLKKPFAFVRTKKSHSCLKVEGFQEVGDYVIIDDFIDKGTTVKQIISQMKKISAYNFPIGIVLYEDYRKCNFYYETKSCNISIPIIGCYQVG